MQERQGTCTRTSVSCAGTVLAEQVHGYIVGGAGTFLDGIDVIIDDKNHVRVHWYLPYLYVDEAF